MPISKDFDSIYQQSFNVDYFDCDTHGKLKIVDLCKLLQLTSSTHAVLGGISLWDLQKYHQAWVLNKFRIEIKEMPSWQDNITISTWIQKLDGVRSIRNFQVHLNGKAIIDASSLWVIINTQKRRPQAIAIDHDHFVKYPDKKAFDSDFCLFPKNKQLDLLTEDFVRYSDLDMVNHVTNIKYMEWVIDAIKQHQINFENPLVVDMIFQKELLFQDKYHISKNNSEHPNHYLIEDVNGNTCFQCLFE